MTLASQIRTPSTVVVGTQMAAVLQGEASKPATCFKMNGTAKIEEGIELDFNHPRISGKTALFIGNYYIFVNTHFGAAHDENGLVRRAIIEYRKRPEKKDLELLTQPKGPNPPLLLHVNTRLPKGVKPKEKFWAGVDTDEEIIATDGYETLVSFGTDGAWADVFYGDGSVKRVIRMGPTLVVQNLSFQEQAERRIELALWEREIAKKEQGDLCIYREDRALHQLAAILAIGGPRSTEIFNQVLDLLKNVAREGEMRPNVRQHVTDVLRAQCTPFSTAMLEFEEAALVSKFANLTSFSADAPIRERRSTPIERRTHLAERAARDQQERAAKRGSSADQSLKGKGGSKKK
jgi:hypothetical protein